MPSLLSHGVWVSGSESVVTVPLECIIVLWRNIEAKSPQNVVRLGQARQRPSFSPLPPASAALGSVGGKCKVSNSRQPQHMRLRYRITFFPLPQKSETK